MIVERVTPSGAWSVYGVVKGYLLTRTYYGYSKAEAVKAWKAEARA